MKNAKAASLGCAVLAMLLSSGTAQAQQAYENTTCRAGTVTVLAQADKLFVWSLDHRGVTQSSDPKDPFHGFTQRCVGVVANIEGKASGNGWCRSVDPKTGAGRLDGLGQAGQRDLHLPLRYRQVEGRDRRRNV